MFKQLEMAYLDRVVMMDHLVAQVHQAHKDLQDHLVSEALQVDQVMLQKVRMGSKVNQELKVLRDCKVLLV